MATGPDVARAVDGIKREVSKVDRMPVALIRLPLIVQALDNPECLDGMRKGNPRAAGSLQFVPLDAKSNRFPVPVREVVDFPVNPLLQALQASRSRLRSSRCFRWRSFFSIALHSSTMPVKSSGRVKRPQTEELGKAVCLFHQIA